MAKRKQPHTYFSSDWHMGHHTIWTNSKGEQCERGIITFERWQFKTIQEHDQFIIDMVTNWAEKWVPDSTLYYLGDFGNISYLWLFEVLRSAGHRVIYLSGNHDKECDYETIAVHVDEFHRYPFFISNKIVVSHEPQNVWCSQVNVHGHLHGSILDTPNHINASLHVADYKPISLQYVQNQFHKLPKYTMRFLYEPFADKMRFTQQKDDVIMDKDGRIDLSASRLLQKINNEKRAINNDPYKPYTGGLK